MRGSIPSEIGLLTSLKDLRLGKCVLDEEPCNSIRPISDNPVVFSFRKMTGNNDLTGSIPSEIGELQAVMGTFVVD